MERKSYICEGEKYTISTTNTISLPVGITDLPSEINAVGNRLKIKSSFHISLVCINEIIKKHHVSTPGFKDSVLSDFCEFIRDNPVELSGYSNEFKFVSQNERKTVIVMCDVTNLNIFFDLINRKYELAIEYPPYHVTLYSLDGEKGIFLTDKKDIDDFTEPILNPIGRLL